jgi:hypothetical protein
MPQRQDGTSSRLAREFGTVEFWFQVVCED